MFPRRAPAPKVERSTGGTRVLGAGGKDPPTRRAGSQREEETMGEAREVFDRLTVALQRGDLEAAANCYAEDAVVVTPDEGELHGRERIMQYYKNFVDAFPNADYEPVNSHEAGNTAIDEGYFVGTNTAELSLPTGQIAATGIHVRVRECDIVTVESGFITSHRIYFDQMDFLNQLGLLGTATT
ncbi:MAG: ester cyclase [Nitriliruptorales bacterium]